MDSLSVTVHRFVDDHFPGFVECTLVDSNGCKHQFVEKAPLVSTKNLSVDSVFPQPGHIACVVETEWIKGRKLVRVGTDEPRNVESAAGETNFTVFDEQVVRA
jgi:hypothetical protein